MLNFPRQEVVVQTCFVKKVFLEISHRPTTLLKNRLWHRCFRVNFVKFLRTAFFIEYLWRILSGALFGETFVNVLLVKGYISQMFTHQIKHLRLLTEQYQRKLTFAASRFKKMKKTKKNRQFYKKNSRKMKNWKMQQCDLKQKMRNSLLCKSW